MASELRVAGIIAVIVICSASSQTQTTSASPARSLSPGLSFARLRSKIDVERADNISTNAIAGKYSISDELRKQLAPLSGYDLYLFPGGSYLCLFWSDVPPETIQDKGRWTASEGVVRLRSDSDITWKTWTDRRYLLVRRHSHPKEILAIGIERDIHNFEKNADLDPEFKLLIGSLMQVSRIDPTESVQLKRKLMQDAWRPEFYAPQRTPPPKN